jgi:phosphate transport system substrate-binding protein
MKKLVTVGALVALSAFSAGASKTLFGSGASSPAPLYAAMFKQYAKATGTTVDYQSSNSVTGQADLLSRKVDFAASDAFLTKAQMDSAAVEVLHIPIAIAAVVPAYNLPDLKSPLRFNGDVLARIYMGGIKRWNDAALQAINPGVSLPNLPIVAVYRSDGGGTTSIFTDYLSKVSKEWAQAFGRGPRTNLKWPAGIGAEKTDGVIQKLRGQVGAVGYIPVGAAKSNKLAYGLMMNRAGQIVDGAQQEQLFNASSVATLPEDTRVSITDADIGYPIAGFTWILVFRDQRYGDRTLEQAKTLVKLLRWMIDEGQRVNSQMGFGSVEGPASARAFRQIERMTFGGVKL